MISQPLQLQIEQLVLDDYSRMDSEALQQAISDALEELIVQNGLPKHLQLTANLAGLAVMLEETIQWSVQALGKCIAEAIYTNQQKVTV